MKFIIIDGKWVNLHHVVQFSQSRFGGWELLLPTGTFVKIVHREQAEAIRELLSKSLAGDLDKLKPEEVPA
jgi:hypothetical protein